MSTGAPDTYGETGYSPAGRPAGREPRGRARGALARIRYGIGWIIALVLAAAAALTLAPDLLAPLRSSLRLSTVYPVAQIIAVRSVLTGLLGVLALILLIMAVVRAARREGGRRTAFVAVVLLAVAAAHGYALNNRGLDSTEQVTGTVRADPASWDGTVTVLSLNTQAEAADRVPLAVAVRQAGADVVVLPETGEEYGQALADLLAEDGFSFTVVSSTTQVAKAAVSDTVATTTVLVSAVLGDYETVTAPSGLGFGAVELAPSGASATGATRPTILAVHTVPPLPGLMTSWTSSVSAVVAQCGTGSSTGSSRTASAAGLIIAGDLNATLDHAPMRDLGACSDAAVQAGVGGLSTWPTGTRTAWLGATIDHVLVDSATWRAEAAQVVDVSGSDHRAVVVRLVPAA